MGGGRSVLLKYFFVHILPGLLVVWADRKRLLKETCLSLESCKVTDVSAIRNWDGKSLSANRAQSVSAEEAEPAFDAWTKERQAGAHSFSPVAKRSKDVDAAMVVEDIEVHAELEE